MNDLTLKPTFIDRGGKQVYDVIEPTFLDDGRSGEDITLGQVRIAPDPRIVQLEAKIDALMLEYCPDEMTTEQLENWERHQVPVECETELEAALKA